MKRVELIEIKNYEQVGFRLSKIAVELRFLHCNPANFEYPELREKYDTTINKLRELMVDLKKMESSLLMRIYIFFVKNMLDIAKEGNCKKVFDYADAIHVIPQYLADEQCLAKYQVNSNTEEELVKFCNNCLHGFCSDYGNKYYYHPSLIRKKFFKKK